MPRKGKRPIASTNASKCAVAAPQPEIVEPTQEESNESPIPPTDSSAEQTRKEQVEERPTSPEIEVLCFCFCFPFEYEHTTVMRLIFCVSSVSKDIMHNLFILS